MSQERWDVVLRFLDGPLSYQGDVVARGPVVRMGAAPGPGGLKLEGVRGVDARQAVITAYDGSTVSIAPVGQNQVRISPHENVDWNEIPPIHGPAYLSSLSAFHLGPPGRGCTAVFVECRRLGVWSQHNLVSEAADVDQTESEIKQIDAARGRPAWFIPGMVMIGMALAVAAVVPIVKVLQRDIAAIGPADEGEEYYKFVDATEPLDPALKEGLNQPFNEFVMKPNIEASGHKELASPKNWDARFLEYTTRSAVIHGKAWAYWARLDQIVDDYAYVVSETRKAKLPEVLAAVPYQESQYHSDAQSFACAKGWWQLMPELANRFDVEVRGCKMRGSAEKWSPTRVIPVRGVLKNAIYIDNSGSAPLCRIQSCDVDERTDLAASTRAALASLREAWDDELIRASGAAVQLMILSHNAGYDNSRFEEKQVNTINVLPSYQNHLRATKKEYDPGFYGANITCVTKEAAGNDRCGGSLWKESQHYAYNIVAQHMLAVCYYAKNYGSRPEFAPWRDYIRGEGYCSNIQVPDPEAIKSRGGKKK